MGDRLATTDMGEKWVGGAGSPSNTMSPGPRPISVPSASGVLIHPNPTVWPQYTNATDRTDNGPIAKGEPFYKRSPQNHTVVVYLGTSSR